MRISVALAAYNGERYIEAQLRSLLEQTRRPDEVIVCDDASTDGTCAVVERFIADNACAGWQLVRRERNVGYHRNFLDAVARATGDVICLCDQDDMWLPDRIRRCEEVLAAHPELDGMMVGYGVMDAQGREIPTPAGVRFVPERFDGTLVRHAPADFIGCSFTRGFSMAFRARIRPVFAGQPDTGRLLGHDWLIACAAALCGGFACLNEKLALYRSHGENFSIAGAGKRRMIDVQRRLQAVQMCLDAHEALRAWSEGLPHADAAFRSALARHIAFERRRLRFLRGRNPVRWLALGTDLGEYRRFYRTWGGALTIWAGDLMYTYRPARRKEDGR